MPTHFIISFFLQRNMKKAECSKSLVNSIICGAFIALACTSPIQLVNATEELRAGVMLQIPLHFGSSHSFFDSTKTLLGLTCLYADIAEDTLITTRRIGGKTRKTLSESRQTGTSDQVVGLEGNLFIEIFNHRNSVVELLGLGGTNAIQGAVGAGYSFSDNFFFNTKMKTPYSEKGMRFMAREEKISTFTTAALGEFIPERDTRQIDILVAKK